MPLDTEWAQTRCFLATICSRPNRMRDGKWEFEGETLTAPCNDDWGNALHGLVAQRL